MLMMVWSLEELPFIAGVHQDIKSKVLGSWKRHADKLFIELDTET